MADEKPEKPRTYKEIKDWIFEQIQHKSNRKVNYYDFYYNNKQDEKELYKKALEELADEGKIERRKDYSYDKYMFVKIIFDIKFDKGVFTFTHPERGIATYDMNTGKAMHNNKPRTTLTSYFRNFAVRNGRGYGSTSMKEDVRSMGEYGTFLCEKVFDKFIYYTSHDYRNLGMILPFLKKFEVMYNWSQCGIKINTLTTVEPKVLPKKHRQLLIDNNIELDSNMLSYMDKDVEYFKQLLILLEEERIPNEHNTRNRWTNILASNSLYQLVHQEGYELRAVLRYFYNYIIPYEQIDVHNGLNLLKDYASMHRQMEVPEFKRYPKYLKSNHDIIQGEFQNYKKEYSLELFQKNVDKNFSFMRKKTIEDNGMIKEEVLFVIEVPDAPEDLKAEGKALSHCVGSYIQRVIDGQTQILFLRKEKGIPMVTLEVRENVLIQAKGYANRGITKKEREYINEFAKEKKLLVRI